MINPNDITTVRVDELPPATISLTDIFPFETLSDSALKKATFQQLVDFININSSAFQFEVKTLLVNQSYIDDNFNNLGIGINLCVGWRIANELNGLVTIGQGVGNPVGSFGGSKTHTLTINEMPSHDHDVTGSNDDSGDPGNLFITSPSESNGVRKVGSKGGGQPHNNMQPYLIALKIIKL